MELPVGGAGGGFHSGVGEPGRCGSAVPPCRFLTWSALHVLAEGLELRLPDGRVLVEDHGAAQPLGGPAQTLRSQLLGVRLKWREGREEEVRLENAQHHRGLIRRTSQESEGCWFK